MYKTRREWSAAAAMRVVVKGSALKAVPLVVAEPGVLDQAIWPCLDGRAEIEELGEAGGIINAAEIESSGAIT